MALRCASALLFLVWFAGPAAGQDAREAYRIEAGRAERAPRIDGTLDEEVWAGAPVVERFIQQEPAEGSPATERTEVRVLYDADHLFIGVQAFDSDPARIIATEMRRDSDRVFDEDNVQVIIDTFGDRRSGYMFVTNPLGAKLEQQVFEEGEGDRRGNNSNVNRDWDGVWHVVSRRTDRGWTAELVIPTTTLRFPHSDVQTWGINFMRSIRRKNEQVFWAPVSKAYGLTRVSLAGTLTGLRGLRQGMDLRIKPFVTAGARERFAGQRPATSLLRDAGLDVRYGLTSGLSLDLTINTDFAQVEADEQQVNLTRFSLFFPEKREFFLENAGLFNVGTQRQEADLFFSRRIGLSDTGRAIPIVGGARLTGKAGRQNLALLDIQTASAFGRPGENVLAARYSRDVLARSKVGGLFVNKEAVGGRHFNRTMAADATLALLQNLTINSFVAKTTTAGTSGGDMAFYGRIGLRDPAWNLFAQYLDIQKNFTPEVGFVPRRGIRTTQIHVGPTPRPKKYGLRVIEPMVTLTYTTDQRNRLLTRKVHHMAGFRLQDGTYINFIYNRYLEQLDLPFHIWRDLVISAGTYRFGEWVFELNSNPSRRLYEEFRYSPQTFFGGTRTDVEAVVGVRATSRLSGELRYKGSDVELPGGEFQVHLALLRLDYAFSPHTTVRTLLQYNSATRELSLGARFNLIYRPGSDLYVVYNDLWDEGGRSGIARTRELIVKLTFLLTR